MTVTVAVTEPLRTPITISPEALRDLRTNPLFARVSRDEDESTGERVGLVLAAGITAAAVVVGVVATAT